MQPEPGAGLTVAIQKQISAHTFCQFQGYCETQPQAGESFMLREARKGLEYLLVLVRWNNGALVFQLETDLAISHRHAT